MKIRKAAPIVVAILVPTLLFFLLLALAGSVGADEPQAPSNSPPVPVPHLISYQGRLLDDMGTPINGTVDLIFGIYTSLGAPVAIWQETHNGVSVSDGYFDVLLGETTPLGQNYFVGLDELYLEVKVDGETLSPRQRIASVPYAVVADTLVPGAEISGEGSGGTFGEAVLNIDNTAPSWDPSHALYVRTASGSAVHAESGNVALYGHSDSHYGLYVSSGATSHSAGYFESTHDKGIVAKTSGTDWYDWAGWFKATGNGAGIWSESQNSYGILARGGSGSANYGGWFEGWRGIYANGYYSYGLYTPDSIYVGGKIDLVGMVDPIIGERFRVDSDANFEAGDLLVIDPDSPYLQLSSEPNDTRVIGVVGPKADIQNGELMVVVFGFQGAQPQPDEEGNLPPRSMVLVKADATYGPIHRGDLLTSSSTPGHAMKANPVEIEEIEIYRPGTIIGKALESLESGQGLIRVFVTLQ